MVRIISTNGWKYAQHRCDKCANGRSTKHELIHAKLCSGNGIKSLVMLYHYQCCCCGHVIKSSWCAGPGDSVYFSEDTLDKYENVGWED